MIRVKSSMVERVRGAAVPADLHELVQSAIQLEHSTVPPYLTAMISLKPQTNARIRRTIHSIVVEEMLHMAIGCNLLNALGGRPQLDNPDFLPSYPGPLPMHVGGTLIVGLDPYSKEIVRDVFMQIEEPEDLAPSTPGFDTIGEFYRAVKEKITEWGQSAFTGDPARQVELPEWFGGELIAIRDVGTASSSIDLIVAQGEGATGVEGHYYEFKDLLAVDVEPDSVWPLQPNTKIANLPAGTEQRRLAAEFNNTYTRLLRGLERTFDGNPASFSDTIGLMYDVKLIGERLATLPFPGNESLRAGPPFEYAPLNE